MWQWSLLSVVVLVLLIVLLPPVWVGITVLCVFVFLAGMIAGEHHATRR